MHFFDIVNALSGQQYSKVYGVSHNRNESQRDRIASMVLYNGGLIASYYHAFSGPGLFEQTTINLVYDLARVEIEGWIPLKGTVKALVNEKSKEQLKSIPGFISFSALNSLHTNQLIFKILFLISDTSLLTSKSKSFVIWVSDISCLLSLRPILHSYSQISRISETLTSYLG